MKLTKTQQAIFSFIESYINEKGFPPSLADISREFKFASANSAVCHVNTLELKGVINVTRNVARGIQIVQKSSGSNLISSGGVDRPKNETSKYKMESALRHIYKNAAIKIEEIRSICAWALEP